MVTDSRQVERSILTITAAIGSDIAYLENDDQGHFDPVNVVAGVAALLLSSFLEGVRDAARDGGRQVAASLARRLTRLFTPGETGPGAADVVRSVEDVTRMELERYGDVVQSGVVAALVENGLPLRKAEALARTVRAQADQVVIGPA